MCGDMQNYRITCYTRHYRYKFAKRSIGNYAKIRLKWGPKHTKLCQNTAKNVNSRQALPRRPAANPTSEIETMYAGAWHIDAWRWLLLRRLVCGSSARLARPWLGPLPWHRRAGRPNPVSAGYSHYLRHFSSRACYQAAWADVPRHGQTGQAVMEFWPQYQRA